METVSSYKPFNLMGKKVKSDNLIILSVSASIRTLNAHHAFGRVACTAQLTDARKAVHLRQSMAMVSPEVSCSTSGTRIVMTNSFLSVNYYDNYDFITNFATASGDALATNGAGRTSPHVEANPIDA